MSDISINYKGSAIATMDASGTKTLGTQGKYCEDDIEVVYTKPAVPTGTKQISITANGTTTEDVAAYASAEITVNVQGGGSDPITEIYNGTLTSYETPALHIGRGVFKGYSLLSSFKAPNVTVIDGGYAISETGIVSLALPSIQTIRQFGNISNCRSLTIADLGPGLTFFTDAVFSGCIVLSTLILRREIAPSPLGNLNVFNNTPFKSGGTGGTIYIPKALYDHLGDGTSLDYKAATNWSTYDGYGTITWAQIEGSIYETQYADGTPIT